MITYCQQLILTFINFFLQELLLPEAGILRTIVRSQGWTARQTRLCVSTNNCAYSGLGGKLRSPIQPDPIRTRTRTRCWKPNSSPMEARSTPDPIPISSATPNNYTHSDPDPDAVQSHSIEIVRCPCARPQQVQSRLYPYLTIFAYLLWVYMGDVGFFHPILCFLLQVL